jgi:hypothetical protein
MSSPMPAPACMVEMGIKTLPIIMWERMLVVTVRAIMASQWQSTPFLCTTSSLSASTCSVGAGHIVPCSPPVIRSNFSLFETAVACQIQAMLTTVDNQLGSSELTFYRNKALA